MSNISMKELLEAGVHFGHQTKRWNPKMKPYIFDERNNIYVIDLQQTVKKFKEASEFVTEIVANNGTVLFVGTKKQAKDAIEHEADRCGMYYINQRWLGGTLTNFATIYKSTQKLKRIESMLGTGESSLLLKKEVLRLDREKIRMEKFLGGIKAMEKVPDAIFVVDPKKEKIAIHEANKLGIPVIAIVDTNCDPDPIDFVIPGNDDAIRAIKLFASRIADSILEGKQHRQEKILSQEKDKDEADEKPKYHRKPDRQAEKKVANVAVDELKDEE